MASTYVYTGGETVTDDTDSHESVTYECTMCDYRIELEHDYGRIWHDCVGCESNRLFDPVEAVETVVEKV